MLGRVSERVAHSDSALNRIAVPARSSSVPCSPASERVFSALPSSHTPRKILGIGARVGQHGGVERLGADLDCRHWKKQMASAPMATWARESRMSSPARLRVFSGFHCTAEVECSITYHGLPSARESMSASEQASSSRWDSPSWK